MDGSDISGGRKPTPRRAAKRERILDAARALFAREGLEGASLRAIAAEAGYTPAALYFHFASKEAIYAALLQESLAALEAEVSTAVARATTPEGRFAAAARAFFGFYAERPQDLSLGFYLFRGGLAPRGLGPDLDPLLNAALMRALRPMEAAAREMGASAPEAEAVMEAAFAHAAGLLLLRHTGRARLFSAETDALMDDFIAASLARMAPH